MVVRGWALAASRGRHFRERWDDAMAVRFLWGRSLAFRLTRPRKAQALWILLWQWHAMAFARGRRSREKWNMRQEEEEGEESEEEVDVLTSGLV